MKRTALLVLCIGCVVGSGMKTLGSDVGVAIWATVTSIDDETNLLSGQVVVGSVISGEYWYSTSTPDTNPLLGVGDYWHTSGPYGVALRSGALVFATDPARVEFLLEMLNDHTGWDAYLWISYINLPLANGTPIAHLRLDLWDVVSMTALSSTDLTVFPPNLGVWPGNLLRIGSGGDAEPGFFINATVTKVELAAPSPSQSLPPLLDSPHLVAVTVTQTGNTVAVTLRNIGNAACEGSGMLSAGLAYARGWVPEYETVFFTTEVGQLLLEPGEEKSLVFELPPVSQEAMIAFRSRLDTIWTGYQDPDPLDYLGLVFTVGSEIVTAFTPLP